MIGSNTNPSLLAPTSKRYQDTLNVLKQRNPGKNVTGFTAKAAPSRMPSYTSPSNVAWALTPIFGPQATPRPVVAPTPVAKPATPTVPVAPAPVPPPELSVPLASDKTGIQLQGRSRYTVEPRRLRSSLSSDASGIAYKSLLGD